MLLKKISYFEHRGQPKYWEIKDVNLTETNLIVGINATGKTRFTNVISNLCKYITKKSKCNNGCWNLEFADSSTGDVYCYALEFSNRLVVKEEISRNKKVLLRRENENGEIFSEASKAMMSFAPPKEELTVHVRRDKREYPFLEKIYEWANNFHGYSFTNTSPNQITVPNPNMQGSILEDLGTVPYILVKALKNPEIEGKIISDFSRIGYPVEKISVLKRAIPGAPPGVLFVEVQEADLKCATPQLAMSQGMYRAFSLIVIVEHILSTGEQCTIAIDDLGEGLDYLRSTKLIELLFEKIKNSSVQLIVTSNDRFVINAIDMKKLILLERKGPVVASFNYIKDKEKFDDFEFTGLNNFDFFTNNTHEDKKINDD